MNESIFQKLRRVKPQDLLHVFLLLLAIIPAFILKKLRGHLWLIAECRDEAQDNGAALFRYLCRSQPQVDAVYAICKKSPAYAAISSCGKTVAYGSYLHWIYYMAAQVNISTQKHGTPNAAVCYGMEVVLRLHRGNRVFLQHGVTMHDLPFLHEDKANVRLFCCAARREYTFIRDGFGYPSDVPQLVGFCRFDDYLSAQADQSLVLVMPTWRMWLEREHLTADEFKQSQYYRLWQQMLNSGRLQTLQKKYGKHIIFCAHRNMAEYEGAFSAVNPYIRILRWNEADLPSLIRSAGTLVTDYSSILMDFGYMEKPMVFYQFDRKDYIERHLPSGYFDYEKDGFGPVTVDVDTLCDALEAIWSSGCAMDTLYKRRAEAFFAFRDKDSCARTFQAICRMLARPDRLKEPPERGQK